MLLKNLSLFEAKHQKLNFLLSLRIEQTKHPENQENAINQQWGSFSSYVAHISPCNLFMWIAHLTPQPPVEHFYPKYLSLKQTQVEL